MGGRGSGRRASFGMMADKCHEMHSIDLAWLRRKKLFNIGRSSKLTWSRAGNPTGSIQVWCERDHVRLIYRHKPRGGEWQDVNERVPLAESVTRFGGLRQWFVCLSCNKRCRVRYGGGRFRCRRCNGLKYDTQYEPAFARAASRVLKIRARLGGKGGLDDPFPPKPKGIHWRTYQRLEAEAERLENAWTVGIAGKFGMFGGGEG